MIRKIFGTVYLIWGVFAFFSGLIMALPFILIAGFIFPTKTALNIIYSIIDVWLCWIVLLTQIYYISYNRPKLKKNQSFIFVANHNSYLDSTAIVWSIPGGFKPLGKIEIMKVPIFSIVYKKVCILIDRSSKESRIRSVELIKKELRNGISVLIFPEGTMNKNMDVPLADFYDGAFKIAIETQTPIAPIVLVNARKLMPRDKPWMVRPGIVKSYHLPPIDVEGYSLDNVETLREKVRAVMQEAILKYS